MPWVLNLTHHHNPKWQNRKNRSGPLTDLFHWELNLKHMEVYKQRSLLLEVVLSPIMLTHALHLFHWERTNPHSTGQQLQKQRITQNFMNLAKVVGYLTGRGLTLKGKSATCTNNFCECQNTQALRLQRIWKWTHQMSRSRPEVVWTQGKCQQTTVLFNIPHIQNLD